MKIDRSASDAEMLTGHLSPPAGAIEPSGFDFKRHAWIYPVSGSYAEPGADTLYSWAGAHPYFEPPSTAVIVANRDLWSGGSDRSQDWIKRPNGAEPKIFKFGPFTGYFGSAYGVVHGLCLCPLTACAHLFAWTDPVWANQADSRLWAILAGAAYQALSGGNVATERAFIMALMAFAAFIVLVLRP